MGENSDNKENDQRLAEACRTYASNSLKQKVLAAATNGSLVVKGEEEKQQEPSVNGNGLTESSPAEEVPVTQAFDL
jgi:hypothetical protein